MIQLTSFNGETFTLNAIYIERIQSFPDTTITLFNGKKLVVKEPEAEVRQAIMKFYQQVGLIGLHVKVGEKNEQ
ncbi:MAG: flagellar FlbD family protein [Amphibacillus sp.]|uniref:Flagellar family protein n=1 Tax=Amphibacillus xylanus (strain ATCC 51415 / DSM 6626 / JCM 7361 / LMG 17667 / NBRC 15112 / Ep01) TaxID=698758 RepID=K0IYN9_AMPXN|nr:flagellar FlbD family protein [Amphibacillus xylanus]NMA90247.1 flagellar FlbD family protein [Amphibacillus sp.]BAM47625.1 flagellar family protein [Amphibacillus xylanus NBRC 15112]